jgi:hypothetical protein
MSLETQVSFLLLMITLGLLLYGKRQQQVEAPLLTLLLLFFALALVWSPLSWRNSAIAALIILIGLSIGSVVGGLFFAAITYAIGVEVPGGMSVLLLLLSALFMLVWIHEGVTQLRRIARARALEPGKIPKAEVGVGGVAEALQPIRAPLPDLKCAAWWLVYREIKRHSPSPMLLKSNGLHAIVELSGASLGKTNAKILDANEIKRFIETTQLAPFEVQPDKTATLNWIEEGQEAYVIGLPEWESRIESEGHYRESTMMPVFRSREDQPIYLANQDRVEVHRAARWSVALGLGMFAECALVMGAQLLLG